jgi:hypothetical protein
MTLVLGGLVMVPLLPMSHAQDPANGDRSGRAGRLVDSLGFVDATSSMLSEAWRKRGWPEERITSVQAGADWRPMRDVWARELNRPGVLADDDLNAALAFYEGLTPEQRATLARLDGALRHVDLIVENADWGDFYRETGRRIEDLQAGVETCARGGKSPPPAAKPTYTDATYRTNVVNLLRALATNQSMFQGRKFADVDGDGKGEFGTLRELMGQVPVRTSADGRLLGNRIPGQPLLWGWHAPVGDGGTMFRDGYLIRVLLPDDGAASDWVHETGPSRAPGLTGGSGKISTDGAESRWCAYAWPQVRGETGTVVLVVDESGQVRRSTNEVARWSGLDRAPGGGAAYTGTGAARTAALDSKGDDGDVWTVEP